MRFVLAITYSCLLILLMLTGCSDSSGAVDIYIDEAPAIRITADAMKEMSAEGEVYTLDYTRRSS